MQRGEMRGHYEALAGEYEEHWAYGAQYAPWVARQIADTLRLTATDRIADIGCGTGLFAREVAGAVAPAQPVLCVDPSEAMLRQIGVHGPAALTPLRASAEEVAEGRVRLPSGYEALDAVWLKEAVHHLPHPAITLAGLARLLAPGGRMLIIMLPATIAYPLFPGALRRYEKLQPDPAEIAQHLETAGLTVSLNTVEHELRIERERYLRMVNARYMSVLSTFTDAELTDGIAWMRRAHPESELVFPDRFAFVLGVKEAGRASGE